MVLSFRLLNFFMIKVITLIADLILLIHFCIVIFITSGFFLIPVGFKLQWNWILNLKLRLLHIGLIAFVTLETLLGITCPLTSFENSLRETYQSETFIGYWLQQILFWNFPPLYFIVLYSLLFVWTGLMWKLFPPTISQS